MDKRQAAKGDAVIVMTTQYVTMLTSGNWFGAVFKVFTDLIGDWFWMWMFGLPMLMLYNKTRNFASVMIVGLCIFSNVIGALSGAVQMFSFVLMAVGLTVIIYKVFV